MEQKRAILIDEESFRTKAFEVMDELVDKGAIAAGFSAALIFPLLQQKLFNPEKESEKTEQE